PSLHPGLALAARGAAKAWVRAQALGRRLWGGGRRFDRFLPELLRRLEGLAALAQVAPQISVLGEFLRRWSCFFATVRNRTEGLCVRETFWRHRHGRRSNCPAPHRQADASALRCDR